MTVSGSNSTGYCDVITYTLDITNNGAASTFTGRVRFNTLDLRVIDYSDLPSAALSTGNSPGNMTHIDYSTPSIANGASVSYEYKLMLTPYDGVPPLLQNFLVRDSDSTQKTAHDYQYNNGAIQPIPAITNSYVRISDILEQNQPEGTGTATLFQLDENTTTDFYDTNPSKSQRIYVEDALICDIPAYSIYNGQGTGLMVMEEGSSIIIEDGATLTIDGQDIASCTKMWKGIYVKAGGTLNLNNCTIANAQYGIRAERGATVNCFETVFLDCYVGFYVSPYTYAQDPENPQNTYVNTQGFLGNLFIGSGKMKPAYSGQTPTPVGTLPYAGIEVSNLSSFVLPGDAAVLANANIFENLVNGIIAKNSSIRVGDAFFKDIEYDPGLALKIQGNGIYIENGKYSSILGNTQGTMSPYSFHFDNVHQGIYNSKGAIKVYGMTMNNVTDGIHLESIKNRTVNIEENTIYGKRKGILLDHCMPVSSLINYNTIEINGFGDEGSCIEMNDYSAPTRWVVEFNDLTIGDAQYAIVNRTGYETTIMNNDIKVDYYSEEDGNGIYLEGTNYALVTCNDIDGDINWSTSNYHLSTGVFFEGAYSFNISCNDVTDFRYGIKTSSSNLGQSKLRGNTITDHFDGLHLGYTAAIGKQNHAANVWNGAYVDYAAINLSPSPMPELSLFIYNDDTPNEEFLPEPISADGDWFKYEAVPSDTVFSCVEEEICPEGIGWHALTPSWDSIDIALINGNLGFPYFDDVLSWNSKFHLYRRLVKDTVVGLPASLSNFVTNQRDSLIGEFSNAYDSLFNAIKYHGPQESVLEEFPAHLSRIFDEITYLDSLVSTDLYNNDSLNTLLVARYDSIFLYEYTFLQKDSIINVVLSTNIEIAIDYIEAIEPDSAWQEELQFTLLEFLNLAKTDTLLSSGDIYDLANSCPDKYGDPVYHARSLIRKDSTINYYDNDDLCNFIEPRTTSIQVTNPGTLYPNPASTIVNLKSNNSITQLELYTSSGKQLPINSEIFENLATVNISTLPSGIYYIRSIADNGEIHFYKFIVAR